LLCEVVGFLNPGDTASDMMGAGQASEIVRLPAVGVVEELRRRSVQELILTILKPGHPEVLELTSACQRHGIAVSMIPQPYELYLFQPELADLDGIPLLQLTPTNVAPASALWKRSLDLIFTIFLLPVCAPVLLVAAAVLKIKKGRAICVERRCGRGGVVFSMYRLNSPRHAPNLTPYEVVLQQLGITELPQLINVLLGDMSLVGPRPEGVERARHYTDWHRKRLSAKPGITGLAQVHGLRDHHASEDKTRYDLQYILRQSLFQDASLILQTAWTLVLRAAHLHSQPVSRPPIRGEEWPEFQETVANAYRSQSSAD